MKNETKHTPLPWHVENFGGDKYLAGDAPMRVCDMMRNKRAYVDLQQCDSDAALIVRAVNHHTELVTALGLLVNCPDYRSIKTHEMDQARAILAKVKGEKI
jgi:hypothetical protein